MKWHINDEPLREVMPGVMAVTETIVTADGQELEAVAYDDATSQVTILNKDQYARITGGLQLAHNGGRWSLADSVETITSTHQGPFRFKHGQTRRANA